MSSAGTLEGIDYSLVANDLGIDKAGTASVRYTRLREEFSKLGFPGLPDKSGGNPHKAGSAGKMATGGGKAKVEKVKKTANPKARSAVTKKSPVKKARGGKKAKSGSEEENEYEEVKAEDENEVTGTDELLEED